MQKARLLLAAAVFALSCFGSTTPVSVSHAASRESTRASSPHRELEGCALFPSDNIWNARVDRLPVHPQSDAYIASIGLNTGLHPDFGSGLWDGSPIGIPYNVVSADQPGTSVVFEYEDESDHELYPIPADPNIEGGSDRHILILNRDDCRLYELFAAEKQGDGSWTAGSGAIFVLASHTLRTEGWTSADAAGLPILPGLVRYEEVAAGAIEHAIRFTASQTQDHIWPARHSASTGTAPSVPPLGLRVRLKTSFDISGFSPTVQVILLAMKTYGLILADNGSDWYISGVPDSRWNNDTLRELRQVPGSAFEAVDVAGIMQDPNSGQVRIINLDLKMWLPLLVIAR